METSPHARPIRPGINGNGTLPRIGSVQKQLQRPYHASFSRLLYIARVKGDHHIDRSRHLDWQHNREESSAVKALCYQTLLICPHLRHDASSGVSQESLQTNQGHDTRAQNFPRQQTLSSELSPSQQSQHLASLTIPRTVTDFQIKQSR